MHQAHQLKNELFVMGGKIQGKPLLPLPECLDSWDSSSTILDWWVLQALLGDSKARQGPGAARVPLGGTGAGTTALSLGILRTAAPRSRAPLGGLCQAAMLAEVPTSRRAGLPGAVLGQPRCWSVTRLPFSLAGPADALVLHAAETVVMEWSQQLRDILSKDSVQALLEGLHPLPRTEPEFWHTRMVDLRCINEQVLPGPWAPRGRLSPALSPGAEPAFPRQLLSPRVTALAEMLQKAGSCFWLALQSIVRDVDASKPRATRSAAAPRPAGEASPTPTWSLCPGSGLEEAEDVSLHLQPLRVLLEEMPRADYSQVSCMR